MAGKIQNEDIKSSAELIAGGGTAAQLPNDDKVYVTANSVNKTLKQAIIDGEIGGGGGGGKNYLTKYRASLGAGAINTGNGDFEANATTGWSLFNTTLTSGVPSGSITAGAASLTTFAATGSGPLQKVYSLSLASSGAVTAGHGFLSDAFYIDKEDQAQILGVSFAYSVVSGTSNLNLSGTSSNTWQVYLYDVTNSAWIQPIGVYDVKALAGIFSGSFQASASGTQYRIALVACNASAGAMSMLFDDFSCGPLVAGSSTQVVSTYAYSSSTLAVTSGVAIAFTNLEYDSHGAFNISTGRFTAPFAMIATVNLSAWQRTAAAGNTIVVFKNGFSHAAVFTLPAGGNTISGSFSLQLKAGEYFDIRTDGSFTLDAGFAIAVNGIGSVSSLVGSVIAAKMSTTATTSFTSGANVKMIWNGNGFDTIGTMVDTTNSRIYVPVSGDYECDMSYFFSAATGVTTGAIQVKAYVNGVDHTLVGFEALVAGNFNRSVSASGILRGLKAGDYVELYIYQDSGVALPGLGSLNGFSLKKIPSDSAASNFPLYPTSQTFLSGSGTYTTPAGVRYLKVRMVGGGGSPTVAGVGSGNNGVASTFGSSLLTAGRGLGSIGSMGAASDANTINSPAVALVNAVGGSGGSGGYNANDTGGHGGSSFFGGAGAGGFSGVSAGLSGAANTGAGGGGNANAGGGGSGGGGAGSYLEALITVPSATYSYTVGAGGSALSGGSAGGSGVIIVEEYYR